MSDEIRKSGDDANQYLTFMLAEEQYAVDVYDVKEVLEYTTVTRVPRTQEFMRGVINLRGSVVPVIDLRLKFGMEAICLADSVQEVINLDPELIEPAPKIGTRINTDFIRGIGKHDERFVIVLDIDRVFQAETHELSAVQGAVPTAEPIGADGKKETVRT